MLSVIHSPDKGFCFQEPFGFSESLRLYEIVRWMYLRDTGLKIMLLFWQQHEEGGSGVSGLPASSPGPTVLHFPVQPQEHPRWGPLYHLGLMVPWFLPSTSSLSSHQEILECKCMINIRYCCLSVLGMMAACDLRYYVKVGVIFLLVRRLRGDTII